MKVIVFIFKCLEGDSQYEKIKLFETSDKANNYITEFLEAKLSEGWQKDEEDFVLDNHNRYSIVILNKNVH